jgi:hypothetical protein
MKENAMNRELELIEVMKEVLAARAAKKASLKGIERMRYNLYWKVYPWALRTTDYRCICIAEIVEKVVKYAPKAILRDRTQLEKAVDDVWTGCEGCSIFDDEDLREDLAFEMDCIFNRAKVV